MTSALLSRRSALLSMASAASVSVIAPGFAFAASPMEAAHKINVAGRQRMLSQRMSRAVIYTHLGIEPEHHLTLLQSSYRDFDKALIGLREGDADLGVPAEESLAVRECLTAVDLTWIDFGTRMTQIMMNGSATAEDVRFVARSNEKLLMLSDKVVKEIVSVYSNRDVEPGRAVSIDVAGRQRMLSQKIAKEAGLSVFEDGSKDACARLTDAINLFDMSLSALINGLPTVTLPAPPAPVLSKLKEVETIWRDYRPIAERIAEMERASQDDLLTIALKSDPLLVTMHDAVQLYEAAP
ncbi:type IV pili methyl-accepting chemotaxis transducer N-terminal domain-containing protein [Aestuariibius insulae]|uniref:type IV pili methyl-accepting chemotaxis transducer N-terminal domain-containing protein n=1 Tax=Aestuariibius insulae TaxID=2058287 RepID=UPI00345EC78D